jgi:polar amino acid transport system substrate-binding protein
MSRSGVEIGSNEVLRRVEQRGQIDHIWNRWLGQGTPYNIPRQGTVIDVAKINFQRLP